MVSLIKDLSILRKFLFINLIVFIIIGILTLVYLKSIQPGLIKKKTSNHIRVIDNTIDHLQRLSIEFNEKDIKKFLLSTRFLFQNLDRVIFIDVKNNLIADTDTLDLDPRSFSQRLDVVEFEDLTNKKKVEIEIKKDDIKFFYRGSNLSKDLIFISAKLEGSIAKKDEIEKKEINFIKRKKLSQPSQIKTCGSTFKNISNDKKAWMLIKDAGCINLKEGDAMISKKHCNFFVNNGNAKSSDIENLIYKVKKRVFEKTGVDLELEIKIIGDEV